MKNNDNNSQDSKNNNSDDSDFYESSYYQNNTAIEYPFYVHNPTESLSASQSNSNFTMSMTNPVHAAKTSPDDQSTSNIVRSVENPKKILYPRPNLKSTSITEQISNPIPSKYYSKGNV